MKYSDQFIDWLVEEGYTHCFFVAGGNIMHLLDSVRTRMTCIPFVHEVAAGIAAEYFTEIAEAGRGKAFVLVTAGPGVTNVLTAMAGAFLESRELLVVAGQVKSSDLSLGQVRQRGIQEVDGMALAAPVSVFTLLVTAPAARDTVIGAVRSGSSGRPGPVFVEFCLDAQAAPALVVEPPALPLDPDDDATAEAWQAQVARVADLLTGADRPVVLIGGGVSREDAPSLVSALTELGIPIATTWNAADRMPSDHPLYFGRPNTWGMRWANILLQQADVVVVAGSRLGLQQTGFNWLGFAPLATVVQVDLDPSELGKGHPAVDIGIHGDAALALRAIVEAVGASRDLGPVQSSWANWTEFGRRVRGLLPVSDAGNEHADGYLDPFDFVAQLSEQLGPRDIIVPCSSGGAFTVMMQAFAQVRGQRIATNKGLASMGYGLSAAIGAALSDRARRTVLVEGDGGFAQNLQELGTVSAQGLNLKIFVFANEGYASIRMTQRNYFDGAYVGCDTSTGLGLPDWSLLFSAYGIPVHVLDTENPFDVASLELMDHSGPAAFVVPVDPEQTYYPKINSRVTPSGSMESSPLHLMHPPLSPELAAVVMPYLIEERANEQD